MCPSSSSGGHVSLGALGDKSAVVFSVPMIDSLDPLAFPPSGTALSFDTNTTIFPLNLQKLQESSQIIQNKIESFLNEQCKERKEEFKNVQSSSSSSSSSINTQKEPSFDFFRTTNAALESLWKFEVLFLNLQQKLFSLIQKGDEVSFFQKREELGKVPKSQSKPLYYGKVFSSNLKKQTLILDSIQNRTNSTNFDQQSTPLAEMVKIFFHQVVSIRFASSCQEISKKLDDDDLVKNKSKSGKTLGKGSKKRKRRKLSTCLGIKKTKHKGVSSFVFEKNQISKEIQDVKTEKKNELEKFDLVQYMGPGVHFQEFAEIIAFLKVNVKIRFLLNQEEKNVKLKFIHKIP